ncbi:MAG: VWA domain-containing protein [Thermoguttaceae bacterium]|nr:VWA domain-containing protein [Thermoguttaceae bacterium]
MTRQIFPLMLITILMGVWNVASAQNILTDAEPILENATEALSAGAVSVIPDNENGAESVQSIVPMNVPLAEPLMEVNTTDDADYFVLSLPPVQETLEPKLDVVVVCDTSATMNGKFREDQLSVLNDVVNSLNSPDRVQIFAADISTFPMVPSLSDPKSTEVQDGIAKLTKRTPLGSMDFGKAINAAKGAFDSASDATRVIVFIGQGSSRAKLIAAKDLADLGDALAKDHVSMDAVALGPNVDPTVLKTLASKSGGMVVSNEDANYADFPNMIRRKVAWTAGEPKHNFQAVYPVKVPPLRSDRETIVIGKANKGIGPGTFRFNLEDGNEESVNYVPQTVAGSNITEMVEKVEKSNGSWLPLENWNDYQNVNHLFDQKVDAILAQVDDLINGKTFDLDTADSIISEAVKKYPSNPEVLEYVRIIDDLKRQNADAVKTFITPETGELQREVIAQDVATQRARFQVQDEIGKARQVMANNPEEAIEILMAVQSQLSIKGLPPEDLDTLTKQVQSSIREAKSREEALAIKQAEDRTRLMEMRERQIALDNAKTEEQNIQQMMRRFDSLMDEGKYRDAEESAAAAVLAKDPDNQAAIVGTLTARYRGYEEQNRRVNVLRQKGFVDAFYQAELGAVPFPDDPPVVYPDSEVWKRLTEKRVEKYSSMDLAQQSPVDKKLMESLKEETSVSAFDTPLNEVIDKLKEQHGIEIQLDKTALEEESIDSEMPITLDVHGISLAAALRLMLTSNQMMYVIEDEVIKITTQTKAEESLSTRVYPVADLVIPIQNLPPMNGGMGGGMLGNNAGMGGMGGGFGGMMGGAGGGMGMGGMGMGGMGGGMGGFMNNGEALRRANAINKATGGAFFSFKEEVKPAKNAKKAQKKASASKWNQYFAEMANADEETVKESQAKVREVIRQMKSEKRFADIIVVLNAAITNNQIQPWMYETLAIAMVMDNRPAEDVERAYLSALEFCEDPNQMLLIGVFMEKMGYTERALTIYEQLGKMFPDSIQPFVAALNLARRPDVDSVEMMKWASLGLLRQEVEPEDKPDWDAALLCAKAISARLEAEGKTEDAKAFAKDLENALQRDCVVTVSWTGDADIDLFVEEPNGSLCSLMNRRTVGGGFIESNGFTKDGGRDVSSKASEKYICSQGFPGTYRVMAKRVYGDVTGNKVVVEGTIHYGTGEAKTIKTAIPLENDMCAIEFALDEGRRTEALETARLNTAIAKGKESQIAQKLFANVDHKAMADYAASGEGGLVPGFVNLSGAVGYMPVIWTLKPGATYGATGVVSADRRYVRISVAPSFSSIKSVKTFNFVTGDSNDNSSMYGGGSGGGNRGSSY